jgi:hypothetical protein
MGGGLLLVSKSEHMLPLYLLVEGKGGRPLLVYMQVYETYET